MVSLYKNTTNSHLSITTKPGKNSDRLMATELFSSYQQLDILNRYGTFLLFKDDATEQVFHKAVGVALGVIKSPLHCWSLP